MNAHTLFRLEALASTNLSRLDLSDSENVKDAAHQLRRCLTPGDFECWARTWGDQLIRACGEASPGFVSEEEYEEANDAAQDAEKRAGALQDAIEAAVRALDAAMEGAPDRLVNAVGDITSKLEGAL